MSCRTLLRTADVEADILGGDEDGGISGIEQRGAFVQIGPALEVVARDKRAGNGVKGRTSSRFSNGKGIAWPL